VALGENLQTRGLVDTSSSFLVPLENEDDDETRNVYNRVYKPNTFSRFDE
jgi:hypothetical protein